MLSPSEITTLLKAGKWQQAGQALLDQDMFIGYRASTESTWKGDLARVLDFGGRCHVCTKTMYKGDTGIWIKSRGIWHVECYESEL